MSLDTMSPIGSPIGPFSSLMVPSPLGPNLTTFKNFRIRTVYLAASAVGNNDMYTVPAGKKAIFLYTYHNNQTGGAITIRPTIKISGVYYTVFGVVSVGAGAYSGRNPIVAPGNAGDIFSVVCSAVNLTVYMMILEFDDSDPNIRFARKIGFNVINTPEILYTCPTGKQAIGLNAQINNMVDAWYSPLLQSNDSGVAVSFITHFVPNGIVVGAGTRLHASTSTANNNRMTPAAMLSNFLLNAGDSIQVQSTSINANQLTAMIVQEF